MVRWLKKVQNDKKIVIFNVLPYNYKRCCDNKIAQLIMMVIWPSGKATVCKTVIAGSTPVITLKKALP